MKSVKAPVTIRAAIHAIIVGQMAAVLIQHRTDLTSAVECHAALVAAKFGDASINRLLSRAIVAATESLKSQETRT